MASIVPSLHHLSRVPVLEVGERAAGGLNRNRGKVVGFASAGIHLIMGLQGTYGIFGPTGETTRDLHEDSARLARQQVATFTSTLPT